MSANTSSAPPAVLSGQQAQALSANMAAVSAAVTAVAGQNALLSPGCGLLPVCFIKRNAYLLQGAPPHPLKFACLPDYGAQLVPCLLAG